MNARFSSLLVLLLLLAGGVYLWLQPQTAEHAAVPPPPIVLTSNPGAPTRPADPPATPASETRSTSDSLPTTSEQFLILAANWQPAFCETVRNKPECDSLGKSRYDASHFTLHGLWPREEYCGVSSRIEGLDRDSRWQQLPPVDLPSDLRKLLDRVMPGTQSQLERHEWIKHGTCFGTDEVAYYSAATSLLLELNASPVRDLFAANIGKRLTQEQIRSAFDKAFGKSAGQRVRVACEDDGNRKIISEITIGMWGAIGPSSTLGDLIAAARPTSGGCAGGIVDAVGNQ